MTRTVILHGALAKRFGKTHRIAISTPAEAIRALAANHSDFVSFLTDSQKDGVAYRVIVDKAPIAAGELHHPFSQNVHLVPVVGGAKSGAASLLIGAALIATAFALPALGAGIVPLFTVAGSTVSLAGISFAVGVGMALTGVGSLLAPQPKATDPAESPENKPSYAFNGAVNTTAQGQPVPVGYGRLIVGSAVISAGIQADQL